MIQNIPQIWLYNHDKILLKILPNSYKVLKLWWHDVYKIFDKYGYDNLEQMHNKYIRMLKLKATFTKNVTNMAIKPCKNLSIYLDKVKNIVVFNSG